MTRKVTTKRVDTAATPSAPDYLPEEDLEEDSPSYISQRKDNNDTLTLVQYIVYSPTFRVPAFYFLIYDGGMSDGIQDTILTFGRWISSVT